MEQALLAAAAAASSSTLNIDTLIQNALAAGIPPLQVVQRQALQQQQQNVLTLAATNALQQHQQFSSAQTLVGSSGPSTASATAQSNPSTLNGFSLANAAAVLATQQAVVQQNQQHHQSATAAHQHVQQMASLLHQAQQQQASTATHATAPTESNSLPWPIFQPTVNVPYFDMNTYQKVNLDVQASALPSGMDLPLNDMNTLRFFFNFGVHHARDILLREHFHINTPNGQQNQTASASTSQNQLNQATQQQLQDQTHVSSALLNLQSQDPTLYHQALMKGNSDALATISAPKLMGAPLPGSTSAAADPNTVFQLQRDLSTSISINQLQNTLAQINKMDGQSVLSQQNVAANSFKSSNDQIEALLLQNSMLGQQNQAMQLKAANALQSNQSQQQSEGLHRPTAIMPSSMPLQLTASVKPTQMPTVVSAAAPNQQVAAQHQQQQLLGGLGISAVAQQQVPVDPAPRSAASIKPGNFLVAASTPTTSAKGSMANPVPLTSSVLASFLQEQQAHDRMKPTSLACWLRNAQNMSRFQVRGAISDVFKSSTATVSTSSASPITNQAGVNTNAQPITSTPTTSINVTVPLVSQFANSFNIPLGAQLSVTMMAGAFWEQQKRAGLNGTTAVTAATTAETSAASDAKSVATTACNPDAHLLAGTSPFVKLMTSVGGRTMSGQNPDFQPASRPPTTTAAVQNTISTQQQAVEASSSQAAITNVTTTTTPQPTAQASLPITPSYLLNPFGGADLDPTTFLATTELNYTEAFQRSHDQQREADDTLESQRRKSGVYMLSGGAETKDNDMINKMKISIDKPIGTTMINYVNSCLNQIKSKVQAHGVGLSLDGNFRPIDYSSRPIDDIFRRAREQLDRERDFKPNRASVSPAVLQRLHANAHLTTTSAATEEVQSAKNDEDGTSSAPAVTATLQASKCATSTSSELRSKSEQPTERIDFSSKSDSASNPAETKRELESPSSRKRVKLEEPNNQTESATTSS